MPSSWPPVVMCRRQASELEEDEAIDIVIGNNKKHDTVPKDLKNLFEKHEQCRSLLIDINSHKEGYEELSLSKNGRAYQSLY